MVGFPGRNSACCRARAPAGFLLLCSPRKGLTLPEQCGDFPGVRMVHPVSPAIPPRAQSKLPARALLSMGSREQVQRHFPVSLPHCPSGPGHWNGEVPPLLCPGAEQQPGRCSLCRRACRRLCLWGRGTAVRCLQHPRLGQPVPLLVQCLRKPQRNRATPTQPGPLGCCRRYSSHLPGSPAPPGRAQQHTGGTRSHPVRAVRWYRGGHTRLRAAPLLPSLHSTLGTRGALPGT